MLSSEDRTVSALPTCRNKYSEDVYYEYTEFISKNNQHRFKDINSVNKMVKVYAQPKSTKCVVRLLDFYISKLPKDPPGFYLRPLDKVPTSPDKPWYCKVRIGVNTLKNFLPAICTDAGLSIRYTNHSLRATAVTRMYNTGRSSLKYLAIRALRHSVHTSEHLQHSRRQWVKVFSLERHLPLRKKMTLVYYALLWLRKKMTLVYYALLWLRKKMSLVQALL